MNMRNHICVICGTEYQESHGIPTSCPIYEDERQFVEHKGQHWTTFEELSGDHSTVIRQEGAGS